MRNRKQPEVRFKGFTEDWEEHKVRNIGDTTYGGGTPKTSIRDFWKGEIPWIQSSDLSQDQVYNIKTKKYITETAIKKSSAKLIPANSIAIVTRVGVGKLALVSYEYSTSQDFLSISQLNIDNWFGIYALYKMLQSELQIVQGTSIKGITKDELLNKRIVFPRNNKEQQKIGTFFKQLDDKIALQERQIELLKEQKKGFLQKMFPKTGEKTPEVRFAGYTEYWEEKKLGEILEERNEQMIENEEYPLMSFVQDKGIIPKGERYDRSFLVKDNKKKYKKTEMGDFIYSSNNLETGSIGFNRSGNAVISPVYSIFMSKNAVESQFIGILSKRKDFIAKMVRYRQGVVYGQWRIHELDFLAITIFIPSITEQQKIRTFFKQLDDIIALNEKELALLKETKKGFLQKMFV